jgi:hypothetical protein
VYEEGTQRKVKGTAKIKTNGINFMLRAKLKE